jgi:hypothetical protein
MSDLEKRLRDLPVRAPEPSALPAARAEFERSFGRKSRPFIVRGALPFALAGIVGIYLSWAFAAAFALN